MMARPRINDPTGVSDNPAVVSDPQRARELGDEFRKRLAYVVWHYEFGRDLFGSYPTFNQSLSRLKAALAKGASVADVRRKGLHPEIEILLSYKAGKHAIMSEGKDGEPLASDLADAAREIVADFPARQGAPRIGCCVITSRV